MTYVRLDDHFPQHRKALGLDDTAFAMHVRAICYCSTQLSDGFIDANALPLLTRHRKPITVVEALVAQGVWEPTKGGWMIHDYLDWQESSESVRTKRSAAKERMARRRSQNVRTNTQRSSQGVQDRSQEVREQETETETYKNKNKDPSPAAQDDDRFEDFWDLYPSRNGKKLDKAKAQAAWSRMPHGHRLAALVGVAHYRRSAHEGLTIPKDPLRWLQGKCWTDWQTPAEPTKALVAASGNGHRPSRNDVAFDTAALRLGLDPAAANPFVGGDR